MTVRTIPLILASNDEFGDIIYKNDLGSYFIVGYKPAIIIPKAAKECWLEVLSCIVTNSVPNILENVNDKFYFGTNLGDDYVVTIPPGFYSISSLEDAMNRAIFDNLNFSNGVELKYISSSNKTQMIVNKFGLYIDFSASDTFSNIIGFDQYIDFVLDVPHLFVSPNESNYTVNSKYLVHCDIVSGGIPLNNDDLQIIADLPVTVDTIGLQIHYVPNYQQKIACRNIIGGHLDEIRCWLTNQNNELLDTFGENFSVEIELKYVV